MNDEISPMKVLLLTTPQGLIPSSASFSHKTFSREVRELTAQPTTVYCGIDPTASSLHVGHLLTLIALLHFVLRGHDAIVLVGGATGVIGDPSGRRIERPVLPAEQARENARRVEEQIQELFRAGIEFGSSRGVPGGIRFRDGEDRPVGRVRILNNLDWFGRMTLLDMLRDIGRHARVGAMLARDR
jgi:tyrosyl-tRNA synthetase